MEEPRRYTRSSVTIDELRSREDRKHRRRVTLYVLLLLGGVTVFLTVCFFQFFRVSEIRITGLSGYTEEQILEQLPFEKGDNLFSFDAEETAEKLRRALPYLGKVVITRKWPSTVGIETEERTVDMTMTVGEDAFLLSGDLQVLGRIGGSEIVPGVTRLTAGPVARCIVGETVSFREERLSRDLTELFGFLEEYDLKGKIVSIDMSSRFDIYLNYENRIEVYFADMDNADLKLRFLVGIMERLGDTDSGYLDLSDPREAAFHPSEKPDFSGF